MNFNKFGGKNLFEFIESNMKLLWKYAIGYLIISGLLFLLLPNTSFDNIGEKVAILCFVLIFSAIFVYTTRLFAKFSIAGLRNIIKLELNFFIIFSMISIILNIIFGVLNIDVITMPMLIINIFTIGILGHTKTKQKYL